MCLCVCTTSCQAVSEPALISKPFFFLSCYFFHHKTECCIFFMHHTKSFYPIFINYLDFYDADGKNNNKLMRFGIYILEVITKISGSNVELHIMFYQYAVSFSMPSILSHRKMTGPQHVSVQAVFGI